MPPSLARQGARLFQRNLTVRLAPRACAAATNTSRPDASALQPKCCSPPSIRGSRHLATNSDPPNRATPQPSSAAAPSSEDTLRLPRSVQAVYLQPLKRAAAHGLPACDLQLRSYSVRNLEFFADFALRAAYYLNLPASGPVPLPRITKRWTVSKSPFVHKKTKETFERVTLRRLIQIKDAHPEAVQVWLAYLRRHAYYGVGMKANVWEHAPLEVGKTMDVNVKELETALEQEWARFGRRKDADPTEKIVDQMRKGS